MLTRKGRKSYARSMVIYLAIGLILLVGIIGGLLFWYYLQPQFKTLITYLIFCLSIIVIYFVVLRAVFLTLRAGYAIDDDFLTIKEGFPNSKQITVRISQIDKVVVSDTKSLFFRGLAMVKIVVSQKTYKLKAIDKAVAEAIKQRLEERV